MWFWRKLNVDLRVLLLQRNSPTMFFNVICSTETPPLADTCNFLGLFPCLGMDFVYLLSHVVLFANIYSL